MRAVADADRERTAGAAFADHGADDRHLELDHLQQVACDRLGLAALLGADARIGAGRIDEGQDRQLEALGHFHQTQRLAIALRARHAEVAADLGLRVAALLVTDHHHRAPVDACRAADDRGVVGERAIAGKFVEFLADRLQVVERVRPCRMARKLRDLPWRQVLEDVRRLALELVLELADFVVDIECLAMTGGAQLLDLRVQFGDGLFEVEEIRIHAMRPHARSRKVRKYTQMTGARRGMRLSPGRLPVCSAATR